VQSLASGVYRLASSVVWRLSSGGVARPLSSVSLLTATETNAAGTVTMTMPAAFPVP